MKISDHAIIAEDKLTRYLLLPRPWDDKSKFLGRAGFTLDHPEMLRQAIVQMTRENDAVEDGANEYGTFFRVEGNLVGPKSSLQAILIWLKHDTDGKTYFVTLKPMKEKQQ